MIFYLKLKILQNKILTIMYYIMNYYNITNRYFYNDNTQNSKYILQNIFF